MCSRVGQLFNQYDQLRLEKVSGAARCGAVRGFMVRGVVFGG